MYLQDFIVCLHAWVLRDLMWWCIFLCVSGGLYTCILIMCVCVCVCLQAALRRLAAGCPDNIEAADHQQLIKPRLVDSFLLCSNMEESFVWRADTANTDSGSWTHAWSHVHVLVDNTERTNEQCHSIVSVWMDTDDLYANVHKCVANKSKPVITLNGEFLISDYISNYLDEGFVFVFFENGSRTCSEMRHFMYYQFIQTCLKVSYSKYFGYLRTQRDPSHKRTIQ